MKGAEMKRRLTCILEWNPYDMRFYLDYVQLHGIISVDFAERYKDEDLDFTITEDYKRLTVYSDFEIKDGVIYDKLKKGEG